MAAEEVADLVEDDLALVHGGQARLVDDEVLGFTLDQQPVRASVRQFQGQNLELPAA
ncbi:hypothetical protein ACIQVL_05390 [Streptomyces sp. NPDC090499]|uniref:hypothetical protein n=1 Tax=Streptomyces sp. NPDC090499 TaxID=3365965 RepID=UPI00380BD503